MKKIFILLLSVSLFIVGCSNGNSPQTQFEKVMKQIKEGNTLEVEKLNNIFNSNDAEPMKGGFEKITYKINDVEVKGNAAVINTTITVPDITPWMDEYIKEMSPAIAKAEQEGKSQAEIDADIKIKEMKAKFFKDKFKNEKLTYKDRTIEVNMKKEDGKWVLEKGNNDNFVYTVATFGLR
ncbi:hypothetical protein EII29_02810 [Leptotrichia sp. OH3620_COT-345]|uniref:hypothetical protein n=1 Tax=Leptotrichia sp. OH3620_COT-345 TaxID=2491048 RepID=UPI000F64DF83|nr:hypothetical protein [Leptotrichia sp. OH3620_COT-345]RRD40427.1 hypothetical protein EII29_02810 [Leptotrichia sp. OH3620_COT-345]